MADHRDDLITFDKATPAPQGGEGAGPFEEIGTTGLEVHGGRINEEFLPQLQGRKEIRVYKEMRDNDATVGALLFAIEMMMRQVDWRVKPFSEDEADQQAAGFLEECLDDMTDTWEDTLAQVFSMLVFGFAIAEDVFKRRSGPTNDPATHSRFSDGRIGWRKLAPRAQETIEKWHFDEVTCELTGVDQVALPDFKTRTLPVDRFLLFRTTTQKGNPEGRSVLRNAYRSWFYKKRIEEIEGIGIERDLAGLPIAFVPPELLARSAPPDKKALLGQLQTIIRNVRRDQKEGVIFPRVFDESGNSLYEFKLMSTGGRRQFDTNAIIGRYDSRIAMTVLADFILMGHERVGSFALASSKTHLFSVALGSWLDAIAEVFNRVAIPRLFALNTFDQERLPVLEHGDVESVDLTELGTFIQQLSGSGMPLFPDEGLERWIRMQAGMPEPPEDDGTRARMAELETQNAVLQAQLEERRQMGGGAPPEPPEATPPEPPEPTE